jgi:hypothetical protein
MDIKVLEEPDFAAKESIK